MALNETKGVRIYADTHRDLRTLLASEAKGYTMADAIDRLFEAAGRKLPPVNGPTDAARIAEPEIRKAKP
jgi:hypothetical protein